MQMFDTVFDIAASNDLAELVSEAFERDSRRYFTDVSVKESNYET